MKKSILTIAISASLMTATVHATSVQSVSSAVALAQQHTQSAQTEYHHWLDAFNNAPASERAHAAERLEAATNNYQTAVLAEKVAIKQWLTPKSPAPLPVPQVQQKNPADLVAQAEPTKMSHPDWVAPHIRPQVKQLTPATPAIPVKVDYAAPAPIAQTPAVPVAGKTPAAPQSVPDPLVELLTPAVPVIPSKGEYTAPQLTPSAPVAQAVPSKLNHPDFIAPHVAPEVIQLTPSALVAPAPAPAPAAPQATPTHVAAYVAPATLAHPDWVAPQVAPQIKQLTPAAPVLPTKGVYAAPAPLASVAAVPATPKAPAPLAIYATPAAQPTHMLTQATPAPLAHPDVVAPHAAPQVVQLTPAAPVAPVKGVYAAPAPIATAAAVPAAPSVPAPVAVYATPAATPTHMLAQSEPTKIAHPDFVEPHQAPQVQQLTPAAPVTPVAAAYVAPAPVAQTPAVPATPKAPAPLAVYATPTATPTHMLVAQATPEIMTQPATPVVAPHAAPAVQQITPAAPAAPTAIATYSAPVAAPVVVTPPAPKAPAPLAVYATPAATPTNVASYNVPAAPAVPATPAPHAAPQVQQLTPAAPVAPVAAAYVAPAPVAMTPATPATPATPRTPENAGEPKHIATYNAPVGKETIATPGVQSRAAHLTANQLNQVNQMQSRAATTTTTGGGAPAAGTTVMTAAQQNVALTQGINKAQAIATQAAGAAQQAGAAAQNAQTTANTASTSIDQFAGETNQRFANLDKRIDDNRKRASAGIAGVAAMANIPQVTNTQNFSVGAGVGTTDGESALAVGFSARATENVVIKGSVSNDTQQNFVVGGGISYGW